MIPVKQMDRSLEKRMAGQEGKKAGRYR